MNALTQAKMTEGQEKQIRRVVEDAVQKALKPLSKQAAQKLHSQGDKLAAGIAELIAQLSVTDQYADEQVKTSHNYPASYRVKPLAEQMKVLAKMFSLEGAKALEYAEHLPELPEGAEGWFAIPRWEALAETYGEALEVVFGHIGRRPFKNWREGELHERYLCQSEKTKTMFAQLAEKQSGDIILVPAQFGFLHRGQSVRRACETFAEHEFGLGAFAVGCMLLTHPEREQVWEQLHIDCAGDEYAPGTGGQFVGAPLFNWYDGKLLFNTSWTYNTNEQFGSASGFLPQEL